MLTFESRASRLDEMLTFETFSPEGRPWGAYRSRGVQISLVRCSSYFFPKNEIDDTYALRASKTSFGRCFLLANPVFYLWNLMFFLKTIDFTLGILYLSGLAGLLGAVWVLGLLLETSSGFLWSHLWSWMLSGVPFGCTWALFGLLFKFLDISWHHIYPISIICLILHTVVLSNSDFCISFFLSMLPYVNRHGRPNFPKVVSSCFRAGNWEWV